MSNFNFYLDRAEEYLIEGKSNELIFATRKGRTESVNAMNNHKMALLQDDTVITNGDLVTNVGSGVKYFVVGRQSSTDANGCQLQKVNATVDILRLQKHYTGSNYDYDTGLLLHSALPSYYEDVTGKMQQYDLGLKSTSTRRFLLPTLEIKLLDIIRFNSEYMQIDGINSSSYPGLLWVQCSPYNKVIK